MLEAPQPLLTTVDHRKNKSDTTNAIAADESVRTPVGAGKENSDNEVNTTSAAALNRNKVKHSNEKLPPRTSTTSTSTTTFFQQNN